MRETWPLLIMLFGILAAAGFSKRGWDWTDLALTCGTAFMALIWQRNFSVFAVAAAPVLSRHLSTILDNAGWKLAKSRPVRGPLLALNWILLGVILLGALFKVYIALNTRTVTQAQLDLLPVRAATYLNQAMPPGPMFNTYNWGGYLMFATPEYPVFIDGRTDLYDDALLTQWRNAMAGTGWRDTFAQWKIRLVVIEHDTPLAAILRAEPGWRETYSNSQASIFQSTAGTS